MKVKILFLILGILVGSGTTFFLVSHEEPKPASVYMEFESYLKLDTSISISCTFPQMLSTYYKEGKVEHSLPMPEKNPMVFTFSDFNTVSQGMASLSYIDSTQSISTVPLAILHEDADKVVLMENGGESYLTTYTIFKKQGVAIFSKQILFPFLGGMPSGTTAMGTCR